MSIETSGTTHPRAPASDADDAALIAACRRGEQGAWEVLVRRHAGLVAAILRGGFRMAHSDAEDVFQEVFTRLYVRLDSIRDGQALRGWIAQVARNAALDHIRRSSREVASGDAVDETAYEEPLRRVEDALSVRAALQRLPDHQREILDRFFGHDQSYETIASELGIPQGTIASRISRALAALRSEWDREGRSRAPRASTF